MRTVELFCGTKSFSNEAKNRGHSTWTIDIESKFMPDRCVDILQYDYLDTYICLPIDVLWASPPCDCFSVASIGKHWNIDKTPKTDKARTALKIVEKTIKVIRTINPKYFFIENPRGMMRTLPIMTQFKRNTVTYCQYGDTRMKPTDIWTNCDITFTPPL